MNRHLLRGLIALTILSFPVFSGCGSGEGEGEAVKDEVLVRSQATCPEDACEVGVSFGCLDGVGPAHCVSDGEGCGQWAEIPGEACEGEDWCYHGQCFSLEQIPYPERLEQDEVSLFDLAEHEADITDVEDFTVIPYEAFLNALMLGEDFGAATYAQTQQVKRVTMEGNDLNVLGVSAQMHEAEYFEGDLFIVLVDPKLGLGQEPGNGAYVEGRHYFTAAMPGLAGATSWMGTGAQFLTQTSAALGSASCCRGGQPGESCRSTVDPILPDPECAMAITPACYVSSPHLDGALPSDPAKQPFRMGGSYTVYDPDQTMQMTMRGNDMPAVTMFISQGRDYHEQNAANYPTNHDHVSALRQELLMDPGLHCDMCSTFLCNPDGPITFDPQAEGASSECSGTQKAPIDALNLCTQFNTGGRISPECGGITRGATEYWENPGLNGGGSSCATFAPSSGVLGPVEGASSATCQGAKVPNLCQWTDCDDCGLDCQEQKQQFWINVMGCGDFGNGGGGSCCGHNCYCGAASSNGVSTCTQCNEAGDCRSFLRGDPNSRYFNPNDEKYVAADGTMVQCMDAGSPDGGVGSACPEKTEGSSGTATAQPDTGEQTGEETATTGSAPGDEDTGGAPEHAQRESKSAIHGNSPTRGSHINHRRELPDSSLDDVARPGQQRRGNPEPIKERGDPVLLGDGSLILTHHDLVFPGPAVPLTFSRHYSSHGGDRSILGSNWTHNYDVYVQAIHQSNFEDWMPPYCIGEAPVVNCALVHYGNDSTRMFIKSPGSTHNLFYPQAGSTDTLKFHGRYWELHSAEEDVSLFNEHGYMLSQRDRFGNGFEIEYEPTPVYRMLQRHCRIDQIESGTLEHQKCDAQGNCEPFEFDKEASPTSSATTVEVHYPQSHDERLCRVLGTIVRTERAVQLTKAGWKPERSDGTHVRTELVFSQGRDVTYKIEPLELIADQVQAVNSASTSNAYDYETFVHDSQARDYVQWLLTLDAAPQVPTGSRKMRPKRVIDVLGRSLEFEYFSNVQQRTTFGLLKRVSYHAPGALSASAKMTYQYERPGNYPTRLQESFLVSARRTDGVLPQGVVSQPARTQSYEYNWPASGAFESYDAHEDNVYTRSLDFFATYKGCSWPAGESTCSGSSSSGLIDAMSFCAGGQMRYVPFDNTPSSSGGGVTCYLPETIEPVGNPCFLAQKERDDYISQIADNMTVIRQNGQVEVESRYQVDPDEVDYERVVTQRYGGMEAQEYGLTHTDTTPGWQSNLPEFRFDYTAAGPININHTAASFGFDAAQDRVEETAWLPEQLKTRYPLDIASGSSTLKLKRPGACLAGQTGQCNGSPPTYNSSPTCGEGYSFPQQYTCDSNAFLHFLYRLPGIQPTYDYYSETHTVAGAPAKIVRTRLTCEQLASRHYGDPKHNDVIKWFDESDDSWKWLQGRRKWIERDSRRVCAWVKTTDRRGGVNFAGLNFRGQEIVTAEVTSFTSGGAIAEMAVTETLVNADGLTIEERQATSASSSWIRADGYTTYEYEDLEPNGADGWNAWEPTRWSNRFNLKRVRWYPEAGLTTLAHQWDPGLNALSAEPIEYKEVAYEYEPLFNQPFSVHASTKTAAGLELTQKVVYTYDYQEFDRSSAAFKQALMWAKGWGLHVHPSYRDATVESAPNSFWLENTIRVPFYDTDLDGDGFVGFPNFSHTPEPIFRGFAVRQTVFDVTDPSGQTQRSDHVSPSLHGLPARVLTAGGEETVYEYRSFEGDSFGELPVADSEVSMQRGGLLGRVRTRQQRNYGKPNESGGFDAHSVFPGSLQWQWCHELKSGYEWLMPFSCENQNATSWLMQAGLPSDLIDKMRRNPDQENWSEIDLVYTTLGHPKAAMSDGVQVATWVRDSDGLVMEQTDAQGVVTKITRNASRDVTQIKRLDQGEIVSNVHQQYDLEGNLVTRCTAVNSVGCPGAVASATPVAEDTPRQMLWASYLLETWRYNAEGQMISSRDEMGLKTAATLDARGLVTEVSATASPTQTRQIAYEYDIKGRVLKEKHGSSAARTLHGPRDWVYDYTGFDELRSERLEERVQGAGTAVTVGRQYAYSSRGELVAERLGETPYGALSGVGQGQLGQESLWAYDGYGAPVVSQEGGLERALMSYNPRGRLRKLQIKPIDSSGVLGEGSTQWFDYDAQGRLSWSLDQEGTMQLAYYDVPGRGQYGATLRHDREAGTWSATTSEEHYDVRGYPAQAIRTGAKGELQESTFVFDAMGRLVESTTPDQQVTTHSYNLVGWPIETLEPQDSAMTVMTTRHYNARGQVVKVLEPGTSLRQTSYTYNLFGQRTARTPPPSTASGPLFDEYAYDDYGRLSVHTQRQAGGPALHAERSWSYENVLSANGLQVERLTSVTTSEPGAGVSGLDQVRRQDVLGRVVKTTDYNLRANALMGWVDPRVVSAYEEYDALGRTVSQRHVVQAGTQNVSDKATTHAYELDAKGRWQARLRYPSGTEWTQEFNGAGQLAKLSRSKVEGIAVPTLESVIELRWQGDLTLGRTQRYRNGVNADPFKQLNERDGLGRLTAQRYEAVEFNSQGQPVNGAWGNMYCQGSWTSACEAPLYEAQTSYDVLDRAVSTTRRFGHVTGAMHQEQWRGYGYNARGFLSQEWHKEAVTVPPFEHPPNHEATPGQVEALGQVLSAKQWHWNRELDGDVTQIAPGQNNAEPARWQHVNAQGGSSRGADHQLEQIWTPGQGLFAISHDARGRVKHDGSSEYWFDAHDRLVVSKVVSASEREAYLYDVQGRLVEVNREQPWQEPTWEHFAYDGWQMLASYHDGELNWEATWGAHLDELLEWRHVSAPGGEKRYLPIQDRRRNIVALYDTEAFTLTALADYTAQGHRTALDSNEAVVCEEEGTGAICDSLGGAFPFGFNTAWRSSRTGLYAMRHRWYSPTLGEFLSHDPLEEVDSFNLYAFAAHDPINSWDPFGLRSNSLARRQRYNVDEKAYQKLPQGQRDLLDQALEGHETGAPLGGFKPVVDPKRLDEQDRCRVNGCITNPGPSKEMKSVDWEEVGNDLLRVAILSSPAAILLWQGHEGLEPIIDPELEPKTEVGAALGAAAGVVRPGRGARRSPRTRRGRDRKRARRKGDCLTNSFGGATLVLRCDGTQSPIEELEEGDWVWARDVLTGQESCEQVTETFVHEDDQLLALTLRSELSGEYERLVVTHDHPMLSPVGEEIAAYALKLDQRLGGLYDDFVVVALEPLELVLPVHNLSVQHAHTFFVGGSAVWTHNCFPDAKELSKMLGTNKRDYHKNIKPLMKKDFAQEMKKLNTTNPDFGITREGMIKLRNPKTKKEIETDVPLSSYGGN